MECLMMHCRDPECGCARLCTPQVDASVGNRNYYPSMSQHGIGGVGGGSAAHLSWLSGAEGRVGALEGRMAEINGKVMAGSGGASSGKAAAGNGAAGGGGGGGGGGSPAAVAAAAEAAAAGAYTSSGERLQPVLASLMAQGQSQGQEQGADTPLATEEESDAVAGKSGGTTLLQELEGGCMRLQPQKHCKRQALLAMTVIGAAYGLRSVGPGSRHVRFSGLLAQYIRRAHARLQGPRLGLPVSVAQCSNQQCCYVLLLPCACLR